MKSDQRKSVIISQIAIFAALYAALTLLFAPISYLNIQMRISELLIAFIPIFGYPIVLGLTLGTFISNIFSPLGMIDLAVGTLATFLGALAVYKIKPKFLGFVGYAVIVSVLVALELSFVFFLPFPITFIEVLIGELVTAVIGAYLLYTALKTQFR